MKIKPLLFLLLVSIIVGCAHRVIQRPPLNTDVYLNGAYTTPNAAILSDTLTLLDSSRNRFIPIATCYAANQATVTKQKLVILNPGYGGKNTDYKYIAN